MKKSPEGWPRISVSLFYDDAAQAIDWLCRAFGFEVRLRVEGEGGSIEHSELIFGDGLVMVSTAGRQNPARAPYPFKSPRALGGFSTASFAVYVDDVEAHCARARNAGAKILDEPVTNDYGDDYWSDRSYRAEDPEGHQWWFMQRLRDPQTKK